LLLWKPTSLVLWTQRATFKLSRHQYFGPWLLSGIAEPTVFGWQCAHNRQADCQCQSCLASVRSTQDLLCLPHTSNLYGDNDYKFHIWVRRDWTVMVLFLIVLTFLQTLLLSWAILTSSHRLRLYLELYFSLNVFNGWRTLAGWRGDR